MRLTTQLSIAFAAILAASSVPAQTVPTQPAVTQNATSDPGAQTLSPGDQIRIAVWRKPDMSCDCIVAGNGTIIHPLYREVQVVGVPINVVEDRMRTFLSKYEQNPQFVIQPLVKIIVRGEIRAPNIYSVPPETTIAQAIAIAGGPTDQGLLEDVRVIRDRQAIKMDVSRPDSDAGFLQIRSNDQIIVGRRKKSVLQYVSPVTSTIAAIVTIYSLVTR